VGLFAKPKMILSAFSGFLGKKKEGSDILKDIELPLWVSFVGVPVVGLVMVWMGHEWFGVSGSGARWRSRWCLCSR